MFSVQRGLTLPHESFGKRTRSHKWKLRFLQFVKLFFFQFTYTVHQTKWCKLFLLLFMQLFPAREPCTQSMTADVRRKRWRPARLMLNFHVFCHTHFSSLNATNFVCAAAERTLSKYRISRRASSSTAHERWWLCFVQPAKSHRTELKCERV